MYNIIEKFTVNPERLKKFQRVFKRMPDFICYSLCVLAGFILYVSAVHTRKRVKRNLADLLGPTHSLRLSRLCRSYFTHLMLVLFEILIRSSALESAKQRTFGTEGEQHLEEALQHGKGVVLFTPHTGNFFYYYWYVSKKYPCLTVATAGSKELRPLYELFEQMGCNGLDYDTVPPLKLLKNLRRHLNNNGVVMLLGDFSRPTFPPARFFGRSTRSPGGAATFALEQQVPIVPFYGFRRRRFEHRLVFEPPVFLHREYKPHERFEATNELNQRLESMILRAPEQWFYWFNVDERWEPAATLQKANDC
jgi:phosphatidylinositol dimannoside acyltransferase